MYTDKKLWSAKLVLFISCSAFLCLIMGMSTIALWGSIGVMLLVGMFLWKKSFVTEIKNFWRNPIYVGFAFLFTCSLGLQFYNKWTLNHKMIVLSDWIGINVKNFILFWGIIGSVVAVPFVSCILAYYVHMAKWNYHEISEKSSEIKEGQNSKPKIVSEISINKAFFILATIYILGISSIIRTNFNYIDDMGRVANGYTNFAWGRILSDSLSHLIHTDNYLTDISPLPQWIATLILAAAGVIMLYTIVERTHFTIWELLALVPFGLNPYFLECLSYKFDSPYMALSILATIVPLIYRKNSTCAYIVASAIGTVAVCATYQASSGIFPMLVVFLTLIMWTQKKPFKKIGKFFLHSVAGYGIGMIFFRIIIIIPSNSYNYASTSLPPFKKLLPTVFHNFKTYFTLIQIDFKPIWLLLTGILLLGFICAIIKLSKRSIFQSALMGLCTLVIMLLLCFGVYPALPKPIFAPRAMYGFGIWITIQAIAIAENQKPLPFKLSYSILSWCFFVFAFTYGNTLYAQKEYIDFRIQMVIDDLNHMEVFLSDKPVTVQISGSIGRSPIINNNPQNYQMLNHLIPDMFCGLWRWGKEGFFEYYGLKNVIRDPSYDSPMLELPVLEDTMYHRIRGNEEYILIELK